MPLSPSEVGRRVAESRNRAGVTQQQLASGVGLDRSAIAKIETGDRRLSALELARVAEFLNDRIEWFVFDAPEPIIARRNVQDPGAASPRIDDEIERLSRAVTFVLEHDVAFTLPAAPIFDRPSNLESANALARRARRSMNADERGPLLDLGAAVLRIGLVAFSVELGVDAADAAMVRLPEGGVSVVNATLKTGRRRLALAHELGHLLINDGYTIDFSVAEHDDADRRESMLDAFARALLLPDRAIQDEWDRRPTVTRDDLRTAAVVVASTYRVDMATLARRLRDLRLVDTAAANFIRGISTNRSDIVEWGLNTLGELEPGTLPLEYQRAVLRLHREEIVTPERARDLLLDTWDEDLPPLSVRPEHDVWDFVS